MNDCGLMAVKSGERLALQGVEVAANITGLLATTTLTQKYKNHTATNLEVTYTFPLPASGTLLSFSVAIGERTYQGAVIPRAKAEVDYEKAIGEGNSAFRLQEVRAGMYTATLGNVMAGESVDIALTFAEPLAWNGKSIRYRLPTTIAPRYGEPTGMQPWQRPATSLDAEYALNLKVVIAEPLAHSAIACPSHKVSMKFGSEGLSIILANGASMDRDFILEIQNEQVQSLGFTASARDTHIAMLTLLPPEVEDIDSQRDVVLVVDCSGSMQGDSLALAQEGILLALGSLQPHERFGIVAFGTSFRQFDKALQPANRKNLDMARRWVNRLDNLGGTDINGALELALKQYDNRAMDILLLTDGQDWNAGKAINKAKQLGIRIFSMGIGSAVAEESVRQMADETGGACELIAPTEDMSERIYRHFNRMRQPQMSRLDIAWPCQPLWESRPERACFAGDAYTVFAALPTSTASKALVSFVFASQEAKTFDVPLVVERAAADAIVRVAAKQHLTALPEESRQQWAVGYQLITDRTDYLITAERDADSRATDLPALQVQPQMLPAGWGGTSTVFASALVYSASDSHSPALRHSGVSFSFDDDDYACYDIPAVVRKGSSSKTQRDNVYLRFVNRLQSLAKRKLLAGLPRTRAELKAILLPDRLSELIDALLEEHSDIEVLRAFYQAMLEHDGKDLFDEKFAQKAQTIIGAAPPNRELVDVLLDCLNNLWEGRGVETGVDRYDIPAFLRKAAD